MEKFIVEGPELTVFDTFSKESVTAYVFDKNSNVVFGFSF
jgi:hypothetical protein